jgi:hypothetical protein
MRRQELLWTNTVGNRGIVSNDPVGRGHFVSERFQRIILG